MAGIMTTLRAMFYLLTPLETYYERIEDVPDYVPTAIQLFMGFQVLEFFIACIDFSYYWLHRMSHEVNLFWATHQTHHSAENFNFSVALRQGFLQHYFSWIFYLPLALIIPPQIFIIHLQMNLLFQFWVHTEIISKLGPLEFILNTPSHHRVHHGRNPYCIDKNYAGVLVIWDRLFGTFAAERKDEEIAYGLVYSFASFDPLKTQFGYYQYMFEQFFKLEGWKNKLSLIWKGPSWQPGLPRLGDHQYPLVKYPVEFHDPNISMILSIYTFAHFLFVLGQYSAVLQDLNNCSVLVLLFYSIFMLFTLTTFGAIFDNRKYALRLERIRLVLMLLLSQPLI
ncbi:unnamed protein product, partial [Adineta steineri]